MGTGCEDWPESVQSMARVNIDEPLLLMNITEFRTLNQKEEQLMYIILAGVENLVGERLQTLRVEILTSKVNHLAELKEYLVSAHFLKRGRCPGSRASNYSGIIINSDFLMKGSN